MGTPIADTPDETAELKKMLADLQVQVAELSRNLSTDRAITMALLAQHGDPTHISVKRLAELEGCSEKTIYREIKRGVYTLERVPGKKTLGIPIEQYYARWTPVGALRTALQRERESTGGKLIARHGSKG